MQLHFGVTRDNNTKMFNKLGVDTGFDGIYNRVSIDQLASYLDALNKEDKLPKTILYRNDRTNDFFRKLRVIRKLHRYVN